MHPITLPSLVSKAGKLATAILRKFKAVSPALSGVPKPRRKGKAEHGQNLES